MAIANVFGSLRSVLLLDAATCVGAGALMAFAAKPVGALTGIPPTLLLYAGLALFPIAAFMAWTATRATPPPAAGWLIVAGNMAWVAGSLALLAGIIAPNTLGFAFVLAQAAAVAGLAKLEHDHLRQRTCAAIG